MPAIHPDSTTLGNIPADIDASSSLPTSNATAVIDDGSIDMPSIMDNITIYDESTDITQEAPISLDLSQDEPEISSIEVIVANNTLPTASDTFIADASLTDAPFLSNITDFSDGIRAGRSFTAETFPNDLKILLHNDPVKNIKQYNLDIKWFADELCNHQHNYGLSENLFEPLQKIGKAFEKYYVKNPPKKPLTNNEWQYISYLKNVSSIMPANCSSDASPFATNNVTEAINTSSLTTQATTADTAPTTVPSTLDNAFNATLNVTDTTDIHNNTLNNNPETVSTGFLNSKLFSLGWISAAHGTAAGVVHGVTGSIYNKFESSGYLNGWRKPASKAAVILFNAATIATLPVLMLSTAEGDESEQSDSITKALQATAYSFGISLILNGVNYATHTTYCYFNKKPMHKESIGSKALEALPLLANTSLLIHGGYNLIEATVIIGTNTLSAGLSSAVTQSIANRIFNKTKKNSEPDVETGSNNNIPMVPFKNTVASKTPETNTFAFEENFNLDSKFQKFATEAFNTKSSSRLDELLKALDKMKFFENKGDIKTQAFFLKNLILLAMQNPEIGLHAYNHLQSQERLLPTSKNLEENCSIIPFTLNENGNFKTHDENKSIIDTNTTTLKELLGSFISGLKLNTNGFKFESKIFKAENKYSFERINIFYGTNKVLSIFTPEIKHDPANDKLLFPTINKLVETLAKHKSTGNDTYSKFLFVLPSKSTTAVIEMVTYPSSSLQKDKISIYNPDNLLKNKLKTLTNNAKKYGYVNTKPGIKFSQAKFKHDPFSVYSFIKNSVKNYLETCLLPNNDSPNLLEGLLATFIYKLKLTGLEFETEKVNPAENNQESALAKKHIAPKNIEKTAEETDLENGNLVNTINRKRNNAIAACQTTSKDNNILSIFKSIPPNSSLARKLPREEVLKHLLHKRKSDIQKGEIRKDLLPFADEKGIAIIEIITSRLSESKLIIHDLLGVLADIHTKIVDIAKENGYQYIYNPSKVYSSDWQSKERCQLAAYYFIKKAALGHLALSDQMNSNRGINLPGDILDEVKHNLSINNEYDVDPLHEIKRCDGGVFNLRTYINEVSNYVKILSIETAPRTNKPDLPQAITTEIQLNLGLADRHSNLLANSTQEIITWDSVRFDNWSALFSTKEVTLSQTETGNVYYLIKFPSDFMFANGKMAVLSKQENSEHALLSDLRNLLVYNSSDKDIKIVKKELWINALRELFSKFQAKESTHHETKVFTQRAGFFKATSNVPPNSLAAAPDLLNHLKPGYK